MEIVADASAIMAVLLNEPERPAIELATIGFELIAPGCVAWEIGNALYGAIKRSRISVTDALLAIAEFKRIPLRQYAVDVSSALRIAAKHRIPTYDAYYLECAQVHGSSLITLDSRLKKVAADMNINTLEANS